MKYINQIITILFFSLCSLCVISCGSSGGGGEGGETAFTEAATSTRTKIKQFFGQNGNLWKPEAEPKSSTAGLLVVLLGREHTNRFNRCRIEKVDGSVADLDCNDRVEWSHVPFSCVANGGREHWRALFTCEDAALVRVICTNPTEELTVEAAGVGLGAVCSRHG